MKDYGLFKWTAFFSFFPALAALMFIFPNVPIIYWALAHVIYCVSAVVLYINNDLSKEIGAKEYKKLNKMLNNYPCLKKMIPNAIRVDRAHYFLIKTKYDDLVSYNNLDVEKENLSKIINQHEV